MCDVILFICYFFEDYANVKLMFEETNMKFKIQQTDPALFKMFVPHGKIVCTCYSNQITDILTLNMALGDNSLDVGSRKSTFLEKVIVCRKLLYKNAGLSESSAFTLPTPKMSNDLIRNWRRDCKIAFKNEEV